MEASLAQKKMSDDSVVDVLRELSSICTNGRQQREVRLRVPSPAGGSQILVRRLSPVPSGEQLACVTVPNE